MKEYLKTKIQADTKYYPYWSSGKVIGWWNSILDSEAQKAVKIYGKIEYFKVGSTLGKRYQSLPMPQPPQF